jgi:hypothetical protein
MDADVLEPVPDAPGYVDEVPGDRGEGVLPVEELQFTREHVEALLLLRMRVGVRPGSRRDGCLDQPEATIGLGAGRLDAVDVARDPERLAVSGLHVERARLVPLRVVRGQVGPGEAHQIPRLS